MSSQPVFSEASSQLERIVSLKVSRGWVWWCPRAVSLTLRTPTYNHIGGGGTEKQDSYDGVGWAECLVLLTVLRWILSSRQNQGGKSRKLCRSSLGLFRADCQLWQIELNCREAFVRQTNVRQSLWWDHQTQFSYAFSLIYAPGLWGEGPHYFNIWPQ